MQDVIDYYHKEKEKFFEDVTDALPEIGFLGAEDLKKYLETMKKIAEDIRIFGHVEHHELLERYKELNETIDRNFLEWSKPARPTIKYDLLPV